MGAVLRFAKGIRRRLARMARFPERNWGRRGVTAPSHFTGGPGRGNPATMRHVSIFFAVGLFLGSCAQGEGDRCQLTSDCESGLECRMEVCSGKKTVVQPPGVDGAVFTVADAAVTSMDAQTSVSTDTGAVDAPMLQSLDAAMIPDATVDATSKLDAQD